MISKKDFLKDIIGENEEFTDDLLKEIEILDPLSEEVE